MTYRVELTATVRQVLVHLAPPIKQGIKEGLRYLARDPRVGEPLRRELTGSWKLRVGDFRIIYQIESQHRIVLIIAVGRRRHIYKTAQSISHG